MPLRYAALPGRTARCRQRLPHAHEQQMITLREAEGDGGLLPPEPVKIIICHAAMHAAPNLHPARKSLLLLEPHCTKRRSHRRAALRRAWAAGAEVQRASC